MICLYAITEVVAPLVDDTLCVERDGLRAIYAEVDAPPEQTRDAFLEHESVVEAVMAGGATLPLRFGTTLGSVDEVLELLSRERDRFVRLLIAVRGCVELSVRADPPEAARHAPLDALARTSTTTRAGAAYLVPAPDVVAFADRVRDLQAARPDADLSCTGPWPPYSFMGAA